MKRIISRCLILLVATMIFVAPVRAFANDTPRKLTNDTNEELVIEDEATPLYSGIKESRTYGAYLSIIAAGTLIVFGTVAFVHKRSESLN